MKTHLLKLLTLAVITLTSFNAEAQFLKKLKDKVNRKIEQKIDEKVDKTLDDLSTKKPEKKAEKDTEFEEALTLKATTGSAIIKHSITYDTFNIEEFGKAICRINNNEVRIYGSWVTMSADIQDGYVLVIPNGQDKLFYGKYPRKEQFKLSIPNEAQLQLFYDPVYNPNDTDENGFSAAVSKDYQNYSLDSGEVTIDVLAEDNIQISFSGETKLVTRTLNPNKQTDKKYIESYDISLISGAIDVSPVDFQDNRREEKTKSESNSNKVPVFEKNTAIAKDVYQFLFETEVKITNLNDNEVYTLSYLLNPEASYIGMKADMAEYSDEEMDGESIMIMDNGDVHIFVETQGMKMRMSQGMMGGKQMQNPTDQMANYDYSKIKKTGNTKTILGAKCYEYIMSDTNVKMELWVAPGVNLPNWFVQNSEVVKGHIMEYTITSKEGNMKSETIAINDNINKTINPKEYKKMF